MDDGKMVREKFVYPKYVCRNEILLIVEKLSLKGLNAKMMLSSETVGSLRNLYLFICIYFVNFFTVNVIINRNAANIKGLSRKLENVRRNRLDS